MLTKQELFTKKIHKVSFFVFLLFSMQNCILGSDNLTKNLMLCAAGVSELIAGSIVLFVSFSIKKIDRLQKISNNTENIFLNAANTLSVRMNAINNFESYLKDNFKNDEINFIENLNKARCAFDDEKILQYYNTKYHYLSKKSFSIRARAFKYIFRLFCYDLFFLTIAVAICFF